MARFFAFFTLFHLSLTYFRPEVPFNESNGIIDTKNYIPEQTSLKQSELESLDKI